MHVEDQDLLVLLRKNKDRAYRYLVDTYAGMIYNTCFNLVRSVEDAEDLVQEVFTAVYLSLDSFEGNSKVSTWVYSIAINKSKEFLRSKTRKKRSGHMVVIEKEESHFLPSQVIDFDHPGVKMEDKELAAVLFSAIDQLSENQQVAFVMHKIEGYYYEEISSKMDLSMSSVESLMFRARKKLKELLENYYKEL
jgi:RNA polymerase sigma factor (sigma-70 family)